MKNTAYTFHLDLRTQKSTMASLQEYSATLEEELIRLAMPVAQFAALAGVCPGTIYRHCEGGLKRPLITTVFRVLFALEFKTVHVVDASKSQTLRKVGPKRKARKKSA